MRRAARVDGNQSDMVKGLKAIWGDEAVFDCSGVGQGFPDIIVGVRGVNILLEIKTDKGKLTDAQVYFHKDWKGQVNQVRSLEEALAVITRLTT